MAKTKKKGLADKVRNKKKNRAKPVLNPFELKVNKVKHTVVNKKVQKWEKGNPGLSRSKAVKKRKDTLLTELHHMKKSNSLLDKRFGENDTNLTPDEVMVQRFALEKKRQGHKGDFSLNEEEETLTHYGQSLAENLQDTLGTDSEDEDAGTLKTGDLQFGGFSKPGEDVSWKDKMKEVIADSKKQKYERQVEKQNALEATNELNNKWKSVRYSFKLTKNAAEKKPLSSYFQLFHTLVMQQKSHGGTDKLKTEEERAKEEAEKLQTLEAERLSRMNPVEEKAVRTHVSADDLSDCFALDPPESSKNTSKNQDKEKDEENDSDENGSEDNDETKDGADDNDDETNEDAAEDEDGDEDSDDDDVEESDNYSDLESDEESEDEQEEKKATETKKQKTPAKKSSETNSKKKDLPFIFTAPGSFEELEALLHGHDADEQAIILSRLRKCHHPSLAEENTEILQSIHLYVLQYFGKLVDQNPVDQKLVHHICSCLWETMQTFKAVTASALQKYVTQRQEEFVEATNRRKGRGHFPNTELLLHLALIENLFPTSDFRHPVCTPALHFITQMLSECPVKDGRDVVSGLFLCSLAVKYVSMSKRYVPEVATFLHGIFMAAADIKDKHLCTVFPPFRPQGKAADLLVAKTKCQAAVPDAWSISDMMGKDKDHFETVEFKCAALSYALDLLLQCHQLWSELPCLGQVLHPLLQPLDALKVANYPQSVQKKIESAKADIESCEKLKLKVMQQASKKPEPLRLFEPRIEEFWSGKRKKGGPNRQANERQRLNHKYKREMKAAVREIRRDNEVLAKHQLETVMQKDQERKRKTKDLMHSLANQEGDYKAIKRLKK